MANLAPKFCCLPEASRVPPISDEPTDMHNPSAPPIESFSLTGSSIQSTNARHQLCKQLVSKSEQSTEKSHQTSSTASKVTKNINRYFDSQPLSVSTVPDAVSLLQAAEKIMASELINICLQFILQNVNQNNVLYVYHHLKHYSMHSADSHEDENLWNELLNSCLEIIDIHIENIMESKDFTKLDTATMRDIISRKTLKISSKQKILEALDRWASCNCKCCLLLNQGDFPVLGEKLMCSHHIVPKEPSQNRIPLKTINNIITNSVNTPIQNNCCQSHKNESQISYVHNSLDVGKSSNTSSTVAVRKNSGAKRKMSTSRKLIHGLNDILGYAIKIFD